MFFKTKIMIQNYYYFFFCSWSGVGSLETPISPSGCDLVAHSLMISLSIFFLPLAGDSIDRENKYEKNNLWISNMHQTQKPHPHIQKKSTLRKMSHVWSAAVAVEGDYNNSIRNIYIWVYSIYIYSGCSLCKFGLENNNDNSMLWYNVIIPLQHARRHRHTLSYNRITNGRFRLQV